MTLFGRHRVRATFYHIVAIIFLIQLIAYLVGWLSTEASLYIGMFLFITDYLAEMYDPHPDSPGPWFERHFHRFFGKEVKEDVCDLTGWLRKRDDALDKAYREFVGGCACCINDKPDV